MKISLAIAVMLTASTTLALDVPNHILLQAISEIETGTVVAITKPSPKTDRKIGGDGEVTRFQILPSVWKKHDPRNEYSPNNYRHAAIIAGRVLSGRLGEFYSVRGRRPTIHEVYILWNKPAYAINGRKPPERVTKIASRFENVVWRLMEEERKVNLK